MQVDAAATENFWSKVDRRGPGECWPWLAGHFSNGYGSFSPQGRRGPTVRAHRYAYAALVAPIPEGAHVHHECKRPDCVNPDHLRALNPAEHVHADGTSPAARNAVKTRCERGHEFTPENTRWSKDGRNPEKRYRVCVECSRRRWREWKARQS